MDVSVVIPVMNESENVVPLCGELTSALESTGRSFELLFVDDGSTDGTNQKLQSLALQDDRIRIVHLRRNFGQTAALQAGFDHAEGEVIVTIDGDRQNDPADIPKLLQKLDEGYDVVLGHRRIRQDAFLNRRLPSWIANKLISAVSGRQISDLGCALKAMRSEIVSELELYGEMHRYIAILASARGARCVEVETNHRARAAGKTKYGIGRTSRVLLDLVTVKYLITWFDSPMKLFGRIGLFSTLISAVSGVATLFMKLQGVDMTGNPLLLMTVLAMLASMQFFSFGLLGEVCARIYFNSRRRPHYAVRSLTNFDNQEQRRLPFAA